LLEVQTNPVFAALGTAALPQNRVNGFLRNRKSGGFFVLRLFYGRCLLFLGWQEG